MLFNSFEFLIFLPIVWIAYWSLKSHLRLQNLLVIAASYVFYGWWDWRFLVLIAFTQLVANLDRFVTKLADWCAAHAVPCVSFLKNDYPESCWCMRSISRRSFWSWTDEGRIPLLAIQIMSIGRAPGRSRQ